MSTNEEDIVFETDRHWVKRLARGFAVYRTGLTHSTLVATIGYAGEQGLQRAMEEVTRREKADPVRRCTLQPDHRGAHKSEREVSSLDVGMEGLCGRSLDSSYRDRAPCPGCGHVAIRTIWPQWGSSLCTICTLQAEAIRLENALRKKRTRIADLLERRQKAELRRQARKKTPNDPPRKTG